MTALGSDSNEETSRVPRERGDWRRSFSAKKSKPFIEALDVRWLLSAGLASTFVDGNGNVVESPAAGPVSAFELTA
ncbi:hypothetical protein ACYOEI_17520, partial [Singulisphaera rosea]